MASIFTKNYSTIITGGLGAEACCALITAKFGLNCGCFIDIIVPPPSGGGAIVHRGITVPLRSNIKECDRIVLVTVKFSEQKVWRKRFIVDVCHTDRAVKIVNMINITMQNISVGIGKLKKITHTITTIFDK